LLLLLFLLLFAQKSKLIFPPQCLAFPRPKLKTAAKPQKISFLIIIKNYLDEKAPNAVNTYTVFVLEPVHLSQKYLFLSATTANNIVIQSFQPPRGGNQVATFPRRCRDFSSSLEWFTRLHLAERSKHLSCLIIEY
jgi:hypothetical protein